MKWSDEVRMALMSLLIVLVALKVAGVIGLSWVWVLAPFWIPAVIAATLLVGLLVWRTLIRP